MKGPGCPGLAVVPWGMAGFKPTGCVISLALFGVGLTETQLLIAGPTSPSVTTSEAFVLTEKINRAEAIAAILGLTRLVVRTS